jgi:hypothetical protein
MKRTYTLVVPKDEHGQLARPFNGNLKNNVSKAIDQLSGICAGILADGVVTEQEAMFFAEKVRSIAVFEPVWPITAIRTEVDRIFSAGRCGKTELMEIKSLMESICGNDMIANADQSYSTGIALDSPPPDPVIFPDRVFIITGRFAFGTRRSVIDAICARGGTAFDAPPTTKTHYLVIGVFANRDWANSNYGRKIERAVQLRKNGSGIAIISEEHWKKYLT